jgi:hypothetical protein
MNTNTTQRYFWNPTESQLVKVHESGVIFDPDTNDVFDDLTAEKMSESDDWFEYDHDIRGCSCTVTGNHLPLVRLLDEQT